MHYDGVRVMACLLVCVHSNFNCDVICSGIVNIWRPVSSLIESYQVEEQSCCQRSIPMHQSNLITPLERILSDGDALMPE